MTSDRYVLLGWAQPRSAWFRSVSQWSTSAAIPAEFVKCVSAEEVGTRLASGRLYSAVIVDDGLPDLDRDLVDRGRAAGCGVIVVRGRGSGRDWIALGATAVLAPDFDRQDLMAALNAVPRISRADDVPTPVISDDRPGWRGQVATVCGAGGVGTSTVATALAQGLGADVRHSNLIVLADLALRADLGLLHDAGDVVPSVQELVDAHRTGRPSIEDIRSMTFGVEGRGYAVLLGLRRARDWSALRPRAFEAAFDGLRRGFGIVVCDTDADLEGESETGSVEVEERNVMARTAAAASSVVFAVGLPGVKGIHSHVRVIHDLIGFGVPSRNIVPVVNRAPKAARVRGEIAATLGALIGDSELRAPVFLSERKIDEAVRDRAPMPAQIVAPLVSAWADASADSVPPEASGIGPVAVVPGSLAVWAGLDEEAVP